MFSGFRSRCSTPSRCAAPIAAQTAVRMRSDSVESIRPSRCKHVAQILAAHQLHDQVRAAVGERAVVEDRRRSTDAAGARRSAPRAGSVCALQDRPAVPLGRLSAPPGDRAACRARDTPRPCRRARAAARSGTCCRRVRGTDGTGRSGGAVLRTVRDRMLFAPPAPRTLHHRLEHGRDDASGVAIARARRGAAASSRATSKPSPICAAMLASSCRSSAVYASSDRRSPSAMTAMSARS